MICKKCGHDVPDELKFCPNCGAPAGEIPEEPEQPQIEPEEPVQEAEEKLPEAERTDGNSPEAAEPEEKQADEAAEQPEKKEPEKEEPAKEKEVPEKEEPEKKSEEPKPKDEKPDQPVPEPGKEKKAEKKPKKEKKAEKLLPKVAIERNYLLVYIIGGLFAAVFSLLVTRFAGEFRPVFPEVWSIISRISYVNYVILGLTIGLMLAGHLVRKASGANIVTMIGAVLVLLGELFLIFCCFFFGDKFLALFTEDAEVILAGITTLRWFGIGALILTVAAAAFGFLFHWKRFPIYVLTHLCTLVIALLFAVFARFVFRSPVLFGLAFGMLQAGIYVFPAVGFNVMGGKTADNV